MGDIKSKISTLWIVVLFNMIFADIIGFMHPGDLAAIINGDVGINITPKLLLVFSIMLEIPIAMIFLSRTLGYHANRRANIIAAAITILFVIYGADTYPSYLFFASIEIVCMSSIIWHALTWTDRAGQPQPTQKTAQTPTPVQSSKRHIKAQRSAAEAPVRS